METEVKNKKDFLFGYTDMVWIAITVQSAGGTSCCISY